MTRFITPCVVSPLGGLLVLTCTRETSLSETMIFQRWVNEHCGGKPVEAFRVIAERTGQTLDYMRVYRWLSRPVPMTLHDARIVERASGGACTLLELMDVELIRKHFAYRDTSAEHAAVTRLLSARERELTRLQARQRSLTAELERAAGDIARLRAEQSRLREQLPRGARAKRASKARKSKRARGDDTRAA